jgi:hypothetical protein
MKIPFDIGDKERAKVMKKKSSIVLLVSSILVAVAVITAIVFGTVAFANQNNNPTPGNDPNKLTLTGKIDTIDGSSFMMLEDAPYKASDKVVVKVEADTKITDAKGIALTFSQLKAGQKVEITTLPVMLMIYPAQVKAITIVVK